MHPYSGSRQNKGVSRVMGYARGGAVHGDAAQDKALVKKMLAEHEREEAKVPGKAAHGRLDQRARGGRIRKHTTVNVIVPQRSEVPGPVPAVGPPISRVLPTGGPMLPSVPTPGPTGRPVPAPTFATGGRVKVETGQPLANPEGNAGTATPAPPVYNKSIAASKRKSPKEPTGMKFGGRIKHNGESTKKTQEALQRGHNQKGFASGGRVHAYPKMHAGADSGEGRLELTRKQGSGKGK